MSKHPFLKVVVFFCLVGFSFSVALCSEQKVKVIKKDAELKIRPQVESTTIAELPLGGEFSIAERISEEWIKISLPPNKDGVVQSGYVQVSFIQIINVPVDLIESKDTKVVQENMSKEINTPVPTDKNSFNFGFYVGFSIMTSANRKDWNGDAVFLGGNFSFPLNPNLSLGLQVSFHRWAPNVAELKKEAGVSDSLDAYAPDAYATGGVTYFEIMPYLRVPIYKSEGKEVFVQGGGGVTFISLNTSLSLFRKGWSYLTYDVSDSATRPGMFFALGVRLGNIGKPRGQFTIQYHNTFIEGGSTGYVTFGGGVLF